MNLAFSRRAAALLLAFLASPAIADVPVPAPGMPAPQKPTPREDVVSKDAVRNRLFEAKRRAQEKRRA